MKRLLIIVMALIFCNPLIANGKRERQISDKRVVVDKQSERANEETTAIAWMTLNTMIEQSIFFDDTLYECSVEKNI